MLKLLGGGKLIVGYDLNDDYSQISYCAAGRQEVETLSMVEGEEEYNIPTLLCKRVGTNQWFCGREALRHFEENDGTLVRNLLSLAVAGDPVEIEGSLFDPISLLTLYFKRSLGMLARVSSPDRVAALMITCRNMTPRVVEVLRQAVAGLRLKTDKVYYQSHAESFYYYMLYQPEDLWRSRALLMEYEGGAVRTYSMECNPRTSPRVAYMEERSFPLSRQDTALRDVVLQGAALPGNEKYDIEKKEQELARMDDEMLAVCREACKDSAVASVYLLGEFFSDTWMKESLRYLCNGQRVFQGNNLYGKGACFGMLERLVPSDVGKRHVFLGRDKLKVNVGMKILRQGEETYFALLDAGINWFEAEQTFEFYQQGGNRLEFQITSLTGGKHKLAEIILEDLEQDVSRLRAHISFQDENHIAVEIEDLGLGAFRPATHNVWRESIEI